MESDRTSDPFLDDDFYYANFLFHMCFDVPVLK